MGKLVNWLRLLLTPTIGAATVKKLLRQFGTVDAIFEQDISSLMRVVTVQQAQQLQVLPAGLGEQLARVENWRQQSEQHRIITLDSAAYPSKLLHIADPPPLLFVAGDSRALSRWNAALAIVGSRRATPQGLADAGYFAAWAQSRGVQVISGMAAGIDTAAHQAALQSGLSGGTLAVLGTGIDVVYPRANRSLWQQILNVGCAVSEFPLGTPPLGTNFPKRNRIISGLADAVLVVEASLRSGSLVTARLAAEQGKEVFACPGSMHAAQSQGCNYLIQQGAKLVTGSADIVEEMQHLWPIKAAATAAKREQPFGEDELLRCLTVNPLAVDELVEMLQLSSEEVQLRLLELELAGQVVKLGGNRYQAVRKKVSASGV